MSGGMAFYGSFFYRHVTLLLLMSVLMSSCASYKNNLLFTIEEDEDFNSTAFQSVLAEAEKNYVIKKFDELNVEVFTNKGERIIDPNNEFRVGSTDIENNANNFMNPRINPMSGNRRDLLRRYRVHEDGAVRLPMVGKVAVEGLTLYQVDSVLKKKYTEYYVDPFVITYYANKRVIVLGALGNQIIPLEFENMTLFEVIARSGELTTDVRTNKVSIVRGAHTGEPIIQKVDLSTWQGVKKAELIVRSNDVIYIEPRRRVSREFMTDLSTFVSAIGGTLSLIVTTILLSDRLGGGNQ